MSALNDKPAETSTCAAIGTVTTERNARDLSSSQKLGFYPALILVGGIFIQLASVGLLAFLWLGGDDNTMWRQIVVRGWATRYVVILSLVIRSTTMAHSTVSVSMLSSLALERFETPLPNIAAISIMRYRNKGAADILSFRFLFFGEPTPRKVILASVVCLLLIDLTCLQLTSTALLSDFGSKNITLEQPETQIPYTISSISGLFSEAIFPGNRSSTLLASAPFYPTFVEYSEQPDQAGDGMFDTGVSIRGFLPFDKESKRLKLARYSGMATFYDTRVVCARPSERSTEVRLDLVYNDDFWRPRTLLSGQVDTALTVPRLNGSTGGNFSCGDLITPPYVDFETIEAAAMEWPLAICPLYGAGGVVSSMQEFPIPDAQSDPTTTEAYLIVNTTSWKATPTPSFGEEIQLTQTSSHGSGQWLNVEIPVGITLSLSICYFSTYGQHRRVDVSRSSSDNTFEPEALWNASQHYSDSHFETEAIRRQLGAESERQSPSRRGLFEFVTPPLSWLLLPNSTATSTDLAEQIPLDGLSYFLFSDNKPSSPFCYTCQPFLAPIHHIHVSVFNQIVRGTRNPALALQALLTSCYSQLYYSSAYLFSVNGTATTWLNVSVTAPTQNLFFYVIVTALVVHVLLVVAITSAFLTHTRFYALGNAWPALTQITGEHVSRWMGDSSLTDTEIKSLMREEGLGGAIAGLGSSDHMDGGNRITVRYRGGLHQETRAH